MKPFENASVFINLIENAPVFMKLIENASVFIKLIENVSVFIKPIENALSPVTEDDSIYSVSLLLILESENRMRQSHVSVHDVSDTIGGDKLTEAGILCIPHPKLCGVSHINILANILFSHIAGKPTLIRENV